MTTDDRAPTTQTLPDAPAAHRSRSAMVVAGAAIALGGFVIQEAVSGPTMQSYAFVGPGVFPVIIGALQILVGCALLAQAWRGSWAVIWTDQSSLSSPRPPSPVANVLLIGGALILNLVLMPMLGFVVAATVLFVGVARAFGSRRLAFDVLLGLVFTGLIFVIFARGLGLTLPIGTIWESFAWTS